MAKITLFDKSKLPSRHSSVGPERAPHRSYYYAMGLSKDDIARPFVGVVTTWNEAAPCNIALGRQAQAAKRGVAKAGGTPREFTTITVTDGIAMGHQGMKISLVSREVIADFGRAHRARPRLRRAGRPRRLRQVAARADDGHGPPQRAVGVHVWRLDPARQMAGPRRHRAGRVRGRRQACRGRHDAMPSWTSWSSVACPSAGSCGGQFTANTMACVSEAIGLALPGSAGTPAPYEARDKWAEESGEAVMSLLAHGIRPRDIVTRRAWRTRPAWSPPPAARPTARLHLPAIAHECGIEFDLHDVAAIFRDTPYIADLKPAGRYVMKDLGEAGGVPLLMKALLDGGYLHGDCITVTGRTIAENLADVPFDADQTWSARPPIRSPAGAAWSGSRARWRPRAPS